MNNPVNPFSNLNHQISEQAQQITKRETVTLHIFTQALTSALKDEKTHTTEDLLLSSFAMADQFIAFSRNNNNN